MKVVAGSLATNGNALCRWGFMARQPIPAQVLNRITKDEPLTFCPLA